MSEYKPDTWAILKIHWKDPEETTYRVFAGWYGGYTDGDAWRLSTSIVSCEEGEHSYMIHNESGSVYIVPKGLYKMSLYQAGILERLQDEAKKEAEIELLSEEEAVTFIDSLK